MGQALVLLLLLAGLGGFRRPVLAILFPAAETAVQALAEAVAEGVRLEAT